MVFVCNLLESRVDSFGGSCRRMQPIVDDEVIAALSAYRSANACLVFFVDGGDEAAREITAVLDSCSDSLPDRKIVIISTQYHSVLHLQFEYIYGPTPVNTVTFISRGGAAVIRWDGHGNIEEFIEEMLEIDSVPDPELREFGYPSEECVKDLVLDYSGSEEVPLVNGSVSPLNSVNKEMQPNVDEEMQSNQEKELKASEETEVQFSVSSGKKNTPGQSKELTVLQIRCPDGSSVTKTFKTSSLLSEVREVIAAHFSSVEFGLATSFPRHHYVSEDYGRDLGELDLWPNAVLLIVPADPRQENNSISLWRYTANVSSWAYTLIMYVWNRVNHFFSFTAGGDSQPAAHTSGDGLASVQPGPSGSQRRSNIHTLRDTEKDDDKRRTTYNGNSTQQL